MSSSLQIHVQSRPPQVERDWAPVMTHTHHLRGEGLDLAQTNQRLVAWCAQNGVRAVGVGSPWEPATVAACRRCEGPDRDLYYAGRIPPEDVKHEPEVRALLDALNGLAAGKTLFYLDNETPKSRYGHLWWFNWYFDQPAWHDYSQDRPVQYFRGDTDLERNALDGKPHQRRPYLEVLRVQRDHGALGIWAHPTSWWRSGTEFVTNIATEAGLHLLAQGRLDGMVVMGYNACHPDYQALWFSWLDRGYVIPGFAETDHAHNQIPRWAGSGPALLNRMYCPDGLDLSGITAAAACGAVAASSGAWAWIQSDETPMGAVRRVAPGEEVPVTVEAYPAPGERCFSRLEIVGRGGRVLHHVDHFAGGRLSFKHRGDGRADYLLVRAYGEQDHPAQVCWRDVRHHVLSNPLYLQPHGFRVAPLRTHCHLRAEPGSPFRNAHVVVFDASGQRIDETCLDEARHLSFPADAFLRFPEVPEVSSLYPCMENLAVQDCLAYLWRGHFLRDTPSLEPGQVPPEAWQLDRLAAALAEQELVL